MDAEVDPIATPEIDITPGRTRAVSFDAVVQVRPVVSIPGYDGLYAYRPDWPSDEDVDQQVDRLRENDAELEAVGRPAQDGDLVSIDLHGKDASDAEVVGVDDYLYEVGSGTVVAELDDQLRGVKSGEIPAHRGAGARTEERRGGGECARERRARGRECRRGADLVPGPGQGGQGQETARRHRRMGGRELGVRDRGRAAWPTSPTASSRVKLVQSRWLTGNDRGSRWSPTTMSEVLVDAEVNEQNDLRTGSSFSWAMADYLQATGLARRPPGVGALRRPRPPGTTFQASPRPRSWWCGQDLRG